MKSLIIMKFFVVFIWFLLECDAKYDDVSCSSPNPALKDDLTSALAWGTIDACVQDDHRTHNLMEPAPGENSSEILSRERRFLYLKSVPDISCEMRYVFPIAPINRELKTYINIEFPINFKIFIPFFRIDNARKLEHSASSILLSMEQFLSTFGLDGRACMMRNICEVSSLSPLSPKGILKDLMTVAIKYIFQSSNELDGENHHNDTSSNSYLQAASQGRAGAKCGALYRQCPVSIVGLVKHSAID